MQNTLDLLAANFNRLALQLTQKEYQENKRSIEEKAQLQHTSPKIYCNFTQLWDEVPKEEERYSSHCSLADEALFLAEKALGLSRCLESSGKLASQNPIKSERSPQRTQVARKSSGLPWDYLSTLDPQSRPQKMQIKKILAMVYPNYPQEVRTAMRMYKIGALQLQPLLKARQARDKRSELKSYVFEESKQCQISLNEFKKLARRVYTNKLFRPTDLWCANYLRKNRLERRVAMPPH